MSEEDACPICYSKISIPITIPICGHRFCFCCLKGACIGDGDPLCPLCRREVDTSIFDKASMPGLSLTLAVESDTENEEFVKNESKGDGEKDKKFWLYAGANDSWWRFEPKDEHDIGRAFSKGEPTVELAICGHMYIIDFSAMEQRRKSNQKIVRKIKQVTEAELGSINVRGIAGMRCT